MSIWIKIISALKDESLDSGTLPWDAQVFSILDGEVRNITSELAAANREMHKLMQDLLDMGTEESRVIQAVSEYENYARKALQKGDDSLAREVAEKIALLDEQLNRVTTEKEKLSVTITDKKGFIKHLEQEVINLKQQLNTVKATENVRLALASITKQSHGATQPRTALEAVNKIQQTKDNKENPNSPSNSLDLGDDILHKKLEAAGITSQDDKIEDIFDRVRSNTNRKT